MGRLRLLCRLAPLSMAHLDSNARTGSVRCFGACRVVISLAIASALAALAQWDVEEDTDSRSNSDGSCEEWVVQHGQLLGDLVGKGGWVARMGTDLLGVDGASLRACALLMCSVSSHLPSWMLTTTRLPGNWWLNWSATHVSYDSPFWALMRRALSLQCSEQFARTFLGHLVREMCCEVDSDNTHAKTPFLIVWDDGVRRFYGGCVLCDSGSGSLCCHSTRLLRLLLTQRNRGCSALQRDRLQCSDQF